LLMTSLLRKVGLGRSVLQAAPQGCTTCGSDCPSLTSVNLTGPGQKSVMRSPNTAWAIDCSLQQPLLWRGRLPNLKWHNLLQQSAAPHCRPCTQSITYTHPGHSYNSAAAAAAAACFAGWAIDTAEDATRAALTVGELCRAPGVLAMLGLHMCSAVLCCCKNDCCYMTQEHSH
jgi:hypothetical protein